MTVELWKPVIGLEGVYEVSDLGNARRILRSWKYKGSTRPLKLASTHGYSHIGVYIGGRQRTLKIHRLVLEAFVGPCPKGCEARHLNGNRADNRLTNLAWGTKTENAVDRADHGTQCRGETHGRAKLTAYDVRKIREKYATGVRQIDLAKEFGINQTKISNVVNHKSWRHVR